MVLARKVVVAMRDGLHARPATQFVKLARGFAATIEIERNGRRADAKSPVKLMLLSVQERDEVVLHAEGADAEQALRRLGDFIAEADTDAAPPPAAAVPPVTLAPLPEGALRGVAASEGVAIGPAFAFFPETIAELPRALAADEIEGELARHAAAVAAAAAALAERRAAATHAQDGEIIEALAALAEDPEVLGAMQARIRAGTDALAATLAAGRALAAEFAALPDPYLRARAEDVTSLARQIALALLGRSEATLAGVPRGAVVVADDLTAWDLAAADLSAIGGIVCRSGAAVSHVAIMARGHGIPAVLGLAAPVEHVRAARSVALDGGSGAVHLDPAPAVAERFSGLAAAERAGRAALDAWRGAEPVTRDGRRIAVAANLGALAEIGAARQAGAHGVGLFRTEFLFMGRRRLPGEDEQADTYRRLAEAFAPHPVVVRTLDVGGDKPVAGIDFPREDNPFLGWRGVRMCLDRPDLFKPQLRALLRAAVVGNMRVMVPMVVDAAEIAAVRALIAVCRAELAAEGVAHGDFPLGIMVETPAAALLAEELAREVAFFSIGTNDLTQYVLAADRLNPRLAALHRPDHPAVLRAIGMVCRAAAASGIPVAVCGEAASRPELIPVLVGLGVGELSMSPAAILRAKKCVAEL